MKDWTKPEDFDYIRYKQMFKELRREEMFDLTNFVTKQRMSSFWWHQAELSCQLKLHISHMVMMYEDYWDKGIHSDEQRS